MAGLARRGLIWYWRSLCCTRGGQRRSWSHLESCEGTLAKDGTPEETFWGWNRGGFVAATTLPSVGGSKEVLKLEESLRRASSV
jgi:hypothetical protein